MDKSQVLAFSSWNQPRGGMAPLWCDMGAELRIPPGYIQIHESHPVSTLELVTEGCMVAEYRNARFQLEAGDVLLLSAGESHRLIPPDTFRGYTKMFVSLLGSGMNTLVQLIFGNHFLFSTRGAQTERVRADFQKIIALLEQKQSVSDVSAALFHLMLELSSAAPSRTDPELAEALKYMNAHLSERIPGGELSSRLRIAPGRLLALFKKNYQTTPSVFFLRMRMDKAAGLLQNTTFSIKEIGCSLGYRSGLTFSREFKKHFGLLPRDFRKRQSLLPPSA